MEVFRKLLEEEPPAPRTLDPAIPVDLEPIVLKCLEKPRERRYEAARALAEDLERYMNGEPVAARPAGLGYRLARRVRKHRLVASVLFAAVLVVVVLSVVALQARWQSRAQAVLARFGQEGDRRPDERRSAPSSPRYRP